MTPFFCFWRNQIKISAIYYGSRRCHKRRHWNVCFCWLYLVGYYRKRFNYRSHSSTAHSAKLRLEGTENKLKPFVNVRNDKASLCRRMSHSIRTTATTIIIIINSNNNKSTLLTTQQFSWFSTEFVSNAQALLVHCSAKPFLSVWRVLNTITACCIRIYSAGRRLSSFNLPCNLLGIIPVVGINIIRHVLGLDTPVAAASSSTFRGLQSRILLIGLNYSIIFVSFCC